MRHVLLFTACFMGTAAFADMPTVEAVSSSKSGGTWSFNVTVLHADAGWDHYADGWEVATSDGTQLGFRKLLHPHDNEQPFTRSLAGVDIPNGTTTVMIRAHDSVHGWGDAVEYDLK